jgi:hypothetical protein
MANLGSPTFNDSSFDAYSIHSNFIEVFIRAAKRERPSLL